MLSPEGQIIEAMFRIADKQGNDVDFVLNPAQRSLDEGLTGRDVVPKARQEGISSYVLARWGVACMAKRNTRAVVISHDAESTERMFKRVFYYLKHLRGPKPVLGKASTREIFFPKTDSTFYIGTAGSRKFGRGDTITHLHCSEVAYWPNAEELTSGLFQAVPTQGGEIILESTGNGLGNLFEKMSRRAWEEKSRYRCHFLPWHTFPEYTLPVGADDAAEVMANLDATLEEPALVKQYGLDAGRILWRRAKLEELGYDLVRFKREYPITFNECFVYSGSGIFTRVLFEQTPEWIRSPTDVNLYHLRDHPKPGYIYSVGGDVGAGVGNDNSVLQIICLNTGEQVGEWVDDRTDPFDFGDVCKRISEVFNRGYLTIENNNHGLVTLARLLEIYDRSLLYRNRMPAEGAKENITDWGWRTTVASRPIMIGALRTALASDITIHSDRLKGELDTFVEKKDNEGRAGRVEAAPGAYDDRVIALGCAVMGAEKAGIICAPTPTRLRHSIEDNPFSLDYIIKEMRDRQLGGYPIPSGLLRH